jgi:hypothetical protein
MSFWNGAEWAGEGGVADPPSTPNRAKWPATMMMIIGLLAMAIPMQLAAAAAPKSQPGLWTSCAAVCRDGSSVTVRGHGFTPSAGGQQVFLWVEYPGDYCGDAGCHGFYYNPWVESDGSFSVSFDNLPGNGEGGVKATQWNAKRGKWLDVAYVDYTIR